MEAILLADAIVVYSGQKNHSITNLKLQKTLYYVQGYYSRVFSSCLFEDRIEHWPYGPVVPSVYFNYSKFGAAAITPSNPYSNFNDLPPHERNIVKKVVDKCFSLSARELVDLSHKESPWSDTINSQLITFQAIYQYFQKCDPLGIHLDL